MQTSLRTCEGCRGTAEFPGRLALSESTNCSIAWRGFAACCAESLRLSRHACTPLPRSAGRLSLPAERGRG